MRDVLVTAIVFVSLPFCFARPWIGVLMWSWIGYMNAQRLCWGFAYGMPFAEMVAVATLAGALVSRDRHPLPPTLPVLLLAALWVTFVLSTTLVAINPKVAWQQLSIVSKILLMTFLTIVFINDRQRLRWLALVIALSIGFHGAKGGMWAVLTGARQTVYGPPKTFIGDNNDLALALNMVLPFFIFLRRDETRPWVRQGLLVVFFLSVVGTLMTYSRAGFLGLVTVLCFIIFRGRKRVVILLVCTVMGLLVVSMLPERWFARMETIDRYEQDESAQSRLAAWSVAWDLALDHPLLGAGFRPFTAASYQRYLPGSIFGRRPHDAHSIIFQMLAEQGFIGLALFLALIASTLLTLRQLIRRFRTDPKYGWVCDYAQMLEASFAGYLVSGQFAGRAYFDLFYHLVAMTVILNSLALSESGSEIQRVSSVGRFPVRGRPEPPAPDAGRVREAG